MSPYPGESPLSLWFALAFAIIGALIGGYLAYKIFRQYRLRARVNATRPDPKAFSDYPELQAMVDRFYILRYEARKRWDESSLTGKELDEKISAMDRAIEEGLVAVVALREASEPEEIGKARAEIGAITTSLEAMAQA